MTTTVKTAARPVGTNFAYVGILIDARTGKKLAETGEVYPYNGRAHDAAETIAEKNGWTVVGFVD